MMPLQFSARNKCSDAAEQAFADQAAKRAAAERAKRGQPDAAAMQRRAKEITDVMLQAAVAIELIAPWTARVNGVSRRALTDAAQRLRDELSALSSLRSDPAARPLAVYDALHAAAHIMSDVTAWIGKAPLNLRTQFNSAHVAVLTELSHIRAGPAAPSSSRRKPPP